MIYLDEDNLVQKTTADYLQMLRPLEPASKNYQHSFDYKKIREAIKEETHKTGYSFSLKLMEELV